MKETDQLLKVYPKTRCLTTNQCHRLRFVETKLICKMNELCLGWSIIVMVMVMVTLRTEGEALAKQWGADVMFFETSAKADIAVREVSGEDNLSCSTGWFF